MGKVRRGGYLFIAWKGDHSPRHVHVYRDRRFVLKWDLEHNDADGGKRIAPRPSTDQCAGERGGPLKIRSVVHNNRKKGFDVRVPRASLWFPYARLEARPSARDPVVGVAVDAELGKEGFTYRLKSGREGTVHVEQVLEYNKDPEYLRNLLLYKLTLEARKRVAKSALSRREIIRRLGTSPAQFYRLVDQTNYRKSIDQVLSLLHVLDCEVDMVVRAKSA